MMQIDVVSKVAFPSSYLLHTFHHLHYLSLGYNKAVEVAFEIMSPSSRDLAHDTQQPLVLPYLEELELKCLERMSHVWKCNWNKFLILQKPQSRSSFHNLTTITMWKCDSTKYLFSPLMAKLLSNLKKIDIAFCDGIEEVVSNKDDEDASIYSHTTTTFFPHLDILELKYLRNFKCIGGGANGISADIHDQHKLSQPSWSLCQYAREISIEECDALLSVIPCYAVGQMQKLQVLLVSECKSMTEVFETQEINNKSGTDTGKSLPRVEYITMLKLPKLKILKIQGCHLLKHAFTFSTLECLTDLEKLEIKDCKAMEVIVNKENGDQKVVFPHLKSLILVNLPNFVGFFLGKNEFTWTTLEKVVISECPQITVFTYGQCERSVIVKQEKGSDVVETVNVAVKASRDISKDVLVWTLTHVAQPGHYITLIVVMPSLISVQLILAVGIIAFAAWGLGPLLRATRIRFLQVMMSYIQPLLLWGGVVLIYRLLEQVILHSSTKPSCQATTFEFCSFIVYSFGICILLIESSLLNNLYHVERRILRDLKMIRQSKGGLPTPASLSVVTQSIRQLLIEQAGECLTQRTRQLEDQENVTDPVARLRMQSSALRSGALLQNLGSLLASTVNPREASGLEHSTTTDPVAAFDGGVSNGEAGVRNLSQPRGGPDVPVVPIRIYTLPPELASSEPICSFVSVVYPVLARAQHADSSNVSRSHARSVENRPPEAPEIPGMTHVLYYDMDYLSNSFFTSFFVVLNSSMFHDFPDVLKLQAVPFTLRLSHMHLNTQGSEDYDKTEDYEDYVEARDYCIHSVECGLNFHVTTTSHQARLPSYERTSSYRPTTMKRLPWSYHNLIEVDMEASGGQTLFSSDKLLQLQKLETVHFRNCEDTEEIFEVFDSEIPNLRQVDLKQLDSLNISQLQELHINNCYKMKVIVKGEEECDANVKFPWLKSLKLEFLESLEGFCLGKEAFEFPSLDTLQIYYCPQMTVFTKGDLSTPKLYAISTWRGRKYNIHNRLNSLTNSSFCWFVW
uniref:NB-ARC domains-containing protein n=1 Tax=Tanacetum cinerariifolium TaxID=118510 RepID=A0A699GL71_TANCI|nr:NB-ARC domains-containing protein [Tanacetum cinerariifolium]